MAEGRFLSFLDADDVWAGDKIELQLKAFENDRDLDMVFGVVKQFYNADLTAEQRSRLRYAEEVMPGYSPGTMLISRAAFDRVGPFATTFRVGDFIDWYAKATDCGLKELMLPDILLRRRIHANNMGIRVEGLAQSASKSRGVTTLMSPAISWAHADVESFATKREGSLFAADVARNRTVLTESLAGCGIALVGAAGSIGQAVLRSLLPFSPESVALLDLDENGLVEVVRRVRSMKNTRVPRDLEVLPIGLGSRACRRYFEESHPFDYIVNLAALKHVRSEKDVYSLSRMIDTNVVALENLLRELPYVCRKVFSVSSDKAVRRANLMGASKRIMEAILLRHSGRQAVSTARFANVAFSNGSLPAGFVMRLQKRQPLAAPTDVERYFLSHEEAGQLCLLSVVLAGNREVYTPKSEQLTGVRLDDLATSLLDSFGYEACRCDSEEEAKERADELIARQVWPCYFAPSDTPGEKPLEEFSEAGETVDRGRYEQIDVIDGAAGSLDLGSLSRFLDFATRASGDAGAGKRDYVREVQRIVPTLQHHELDRSLDEKM